jgi:Domain of unknown function (DUF4407)
MSAPLTRFLVRCGAGSPEVLARCSTTETMRFVTAGGTVLATALIAFIAFTFVGRSMLHLQAAPSVVLGGFWFLVILNLEVYIQSSMKRQDSAGNTAAMALPRIALGAVIAFMLSPFVLLVIFGSEDEAQVTRDKNASKIAAMKPVEYRYAEVPALQTKIGQLEAELTTPASYGEKLFSSPEYTALAKRYGKAREEARTATSAAAARQAKRTAEDFLQEMGPVRQQLLAEEREDHAAKLHNAEAAIHADRERLIPLERGRQAAKQEVDERYAAKSGLADKIEALGALAARSSAVNEERWILFIFLMCVDLSPALLKTATLLGRRTEYEQVEEELRRGNIAGAKAEADLAAQEAERDVAEELEIQRKIGEARKSATLTAQLEWDKITTGILRDGLKPHIEAWAHATVEEHASALTEDIGRQGREATPETGAPPARGSRGSLDDLARRRSERPRRRDRRP